MYSLSLSHTHLSTGKDRRLLTTASISTPPNHFRRCSVVVDVVDGVFIAKRTETRALREGKCSCDGKNRAEVAEPCVFVRIVRKDVFCLAMCFFAGINGPFFGPDLHNCYVSFCAKVLFKCTYPIATSCIDGELYYYYSSRTVKMYCFVILILNLSMKNLIWDWCRHAFAEIMRFKILNKCLEIQVRLTILERVAKLFSILSQRQLPCKCPVV